MWGEQDTVRERILHAPAPGWRGPRASLLGSGEMAQGEEPESHTGRVLACVALFVLGWWLADRSLRPAPARGREASAAEFSAQRALERWNALAGSALPHPVGSAAHEELREGIVSSLRALGCEAQVQDTLVVRPGIACRVRNVLVRIPGRVHERAVLVAAHYDSVGAGPGAGDDGAGAASVLEIAAALKSGAPLERDVVLLVDDAEELGLLGARAFCEQHPWAKDVAYAINLEARGTSGPCFLFETSEENAALITLAAHVLPQASAWSASYEVYKRMPNDTDLTVFKEQGWQGYNLAFIRGLRHYHTPRDDAHELSAASVQQMGGNALALARGIAADKLDRDARGRSVYADFFGLQLLHWNQRSNLPISLGLLVAIGFALWTRKRMGRWRVEPVLLCAGAALCGLLLAALFAFVLQQLVLAGRASAWPNAAEPLWMRTAIGAGALCAWFGLASLPWGARATIEERWAGTALFLALLAVGLSLGLPAASYLAIAPLVLTLLGFSMHEIARERKPQGKPWMLAAPAFVMTAGLAGPLLVALEWVFEFRLSAALGFLAGLVFLPLWIMAAEAPRVARGLAAAALLAALGLVFGARSSPAWSREHPAPLTLQHYQEAAGEGAHWYLDSPEGELPPALAQDFKPAQQGPLAFVRGGRTSFECQAARFEAQAPLLEFRGESEGARKLQLASRAGVRLLILQLPQGWRPATLAVGEAHVVLAPSQGRTLLLAGFGSGELALDCERKDAQDRQGQIELFEIDELGKSAAREWFDKRPSEFVPISWGDLAIVRSTLIP